MKDNEIRVEGYQGSNLEIINSFIDVFHSEILPTLHSEEVLGNAYTGINDKKEYLKAIYPSSSFLLLGYANKPVSLMVDDYEFYLFILSYFDTYGNLYRTTEYDLSFNFKEAISVSFFNINTRQVEVLRLSYENTFPGKERVHLYFLISIKSIVFKLLEELVERDLDIQKIILGKKLQVESEDEK